MPEPEAVVKPKTAGFVDSKHNNANKRRIEEEQAEIDKLTATPEGEEETSTEEPVEEKVEAKKEENLSPEEKTYKKRHTDARKYINEQDARIKALEQRLNNPDPAAGIRQPKWVKDALYENSDDPMSVVRVIDLYKVDNGMDTRGKKSSTKEAASAVVSKRTSSNPDKEGANITFKESDVQKMSAKEFEINEEAIMASMKNKSFYDISGAAR